MGDVKVINYDTKKALDRMRQVKKEIAWTKRSKDWFIKGFQLPIKSYKKNWIDISDKFEQYEVDLNRHGCILTLQSQKQVDYADELTKILKKDEKILEMASMSTFPVRTIFPYEDYDYDKVIEGTIFLAMLRIIPEFCLQLGVDVLKEYLVNGNSKERLKEIFTIKPETILGSEPDLRRIVKKMVEEVKNDQRLV